MGEQVRHDPTVLSGGGATWSTCTCGWKSGLWRTSTGASLDFAKHLSATTPAAQPEQTEPTAGGGSA